MPGDATPEASDLLAFPAHILDSIIGRMDSIQDIVVLGSVNQALHTAVAQAQWAGVHRFRLAHGVPSPAFAARITSNCPELTVLDATGCVQLLPESLQALAGVPFQGLHVSGCTSLESRPGTAALVSVLRHSKLTALELYGGPDTASCASILKAVLSQLALRSLSLTHWRWNGIILRRLADLGSACPNLKHLKVEQSLITLAANTPVKQLQLESLSLAGSRWKGSNWPPFLGPQLTSLDISSTEVSDADLQQIAGGCCELKRLNASHCTNLTDAGIACLSISKPILVGTLQDLDISALGVGFTGESLGRVLCVWAQGCAERLRYSRVILGSESTAQPIWLNISQNFVIGPEHLALLTNDFIKALQPMQFGRFIAESCPRLARTIGQEQIPSWNILSRLSSSGHFDQLEVLDLRGVFCSSQQENTDNEAILASTIRGTGGSLKRLLIDNSCTGNDVAEAIASRGACLEELSMPCCTGLSDSGLTRIALACKQLLRLCVGGPSRAWSEAAGLLTFKGLQKLEICRRSTLTSDQLQQVLGQHPLLESLKLSCCPRVTDKALALLPSDSMRELRLVCCDGIEGSSLGLQTKLEILDFSSCNSITERSIQVTTVSCTHLRKLGLPGHIPSSCIPIQATGHLRGLQVTGGRTSSASRKGV